MLILGRLDGFVLQSTTDEEQFASVRLILVVSIIKLL